MDSQYLFVHAILKNNELHYFNQVKNMIIANTYTQLHIQIVFAVQGRLNIIRNDNRDELEKYICGIISGKSCKPLAIYCNPDHIHVLVGLHPTVSVSELVRDIKAMSSKFINQQKWMAGKFHWQDGFGAFSYSHSQIDSVVKYILNQPRHHRKTTFREEFLEFLSKCEVDYDPRYLFEWFEE